MFEEFLRSGGLADFIGECIRVRRSGELRGPYLEDRNEKKKCLRNAWGLDDSRNLWENAQESGGPADSADPILEDRNEKKKCLRNPWGLEDSRTFWENAQESGGPVDSADPILEDRN